MRSTDEVLQDLELAMSRKERQDCIDLCREGALLHTFPNNDVWYAFRINLANFLVFGMEAAPSKDIEEAIRIYREIISTLSGAESLKPRAAARMGMGWAYYRRVEGTAGKISIGPSAPYQRRLRIIRRMVYRKRGPVLRNRSVWPTR